jgi:hypothetical protein
VALLRAFGMLFEKERDFSVDGKAQSGGAAEKGV